MAILSKRIEEAFNVSQCSKNERLLKRLVDVTDVMKDVVETHQAYKALDVDDDFAKAAKEMGLSIDGFGNVRRDFITPMPDKNKICGVIMIQYHPLSGTVKFKYSDDGCYHKIDIDIQNGMSLVTRLDWRYLCSVNVHPVESAWFTVESLEKFISLLEAFTDKMVKFYKSFDYDNK